MRVPRGNWGEIAGKQFSPFAFLSRSQVQLPAPTSWQTAKMLTTALLCLVVGISDGDTLTARCGKPGSYEQVKVRLSAIDAPEARQPFGQRSKQNLADLCFQVEATITPRTTDRYGRTVADVTCRGTDAAQHQVANGMAWYYVQYGRGYEAFREVEARARHSKLGLWRDSNPIPPWDWRATARAPRQKHPQEPA